MSADAQEPTHQPRFAVIIAGSRDFNDYELVCAKCAAFFAHRTPTSIVCGEARGADTLGRRWAVEHGIRVDSYPADWDRFGKRAGFIRNEQMAMNADALIAFWDGRSRGTKHMIDIAQQRGLPVRVVRIERKE